MNALRFNRSEAVMGEGPRAGELAHLGVPLREQRKLAMGTAVADLSSTRIYQLAGADRLSWLNSLTTQRLDTVTSGTSTETLVLSPTGHIEHWIRIYADEDRLWLLIDASADKDPDAAIAFLESMKFMMRVEITDVSADFQAVGSIGPAPAGLPVTVEWNDPWPAIGAGSASYAAIDLGQAHAAADHPGTDIDFRINICPVAELCEFAPQDHGVAGRDAWDALRVEAWRPVAEDADHKALVGELDVLRTAVHLAKGCYRGQEAVARVHNLGQVPRRLVFLHLDGSGHSLPQAGDEIRAEVRGSLRTVGVVTSAALHYELGPIALGVIKRNIPAESPLQVAVSSGSEQGAEELIAAAPELVVATQREHAATGLQVNRETDARRR